MSNFNLCLSQSTIICNDRELARDNNRLAQKLFRWARTWQTCTEPDDFNFWTMVKVATEKVGLCAYDRHHQHLIALGPYHCSESIYQDGFFWDVRFEEGGPSDGSYFVQVRPAEVCKAIHKDGSVISAG